MRRTIAVFMLLIFGLFLSVPLLAASSNPSNNRPACCRRDGKHQCMMQMEGDPGTTQASAPPEKCPFSPHAWQVTQVQNHVIAPGVAGAIYAALQSHPACHLQSETQRRISFDRSRQKRGPPADVVAS
jgi:hypothetical protein